MTTQTKNTTIMNPSFLTTILARFFDSMKMKNPTTYAIVSACVVAINLTVNDVIFRELLTNVFGTLPTWFNTLVQIVSVVYLAIIAPRTSNTIADANIKKAYKQARKF